MGAFAFVLGAFFFALFAFAFPFALFFFLFPFDFALLFLGQRELLGDTSWQVRPEQVSRRSSSVWRKARIGK